MKKASLPISITNQTQLIHIIYIVALWTSIGAALTTFNSILLSMQGISTSWFHLSLNYFSRAWVWVAFTPICYLIYKTLFRRKAHILLQVITVLATGIIVAIIHTLCSFYLDVLLRDWMNIIQISFWDEISKEIPLVLKFSYKSLTTFLLMMGLFLFRDRMKYDPTSKTKKVKTSLPVNSTSNVLNRISVKSNGKLFLIDIDDIKYIESKGNYVYIKMTDRNIMVRSTMTNFQKKLNSSHFFRINRSTLLNLKAVTSLSPRVNGEYVVWMKDGKSFNSGKAFRKELNRLLLLQ